MTEYPYKTIVKSAKTIKNNVEKEYKLGATAKWSYYSLNCDQWTAFRDFIDAIRCTCTCDGKMEGGCCCS